MPSPFPGMDPYIEEPEVWQDFHGALAYEIRVQLNPLLRPRYFAALTPRLTYEVIEIASPRAGRSDVGVLHPPGMWGDSPVPVAVMPAPVESKIPLEVPTRLQTVEIRTVGDNVLVTSIEILSRVNKQPGHEMYRLYQRKRRAILRSDAHLIEIDLLRQGKRPPLTEPVPEAPYYVTLSRAERRPTVEVWPLRLQDPLPVLPVPLLDPDPDVPLDLGAAVATIYERGSYDMRIDYRQPPPPPRLPPKDQTWVDELLAGD